MTHRYNIGNPRPISTASEFTTYVRSEANGGAFYLTNTIDLNSLGLAGAGDWVPFDFNGYLDGRGFPIRGLVVSSDHLGAGAGLFHTCNSATIIRRLGLEVGCGGITGIPSTAYKGALAAALYGLVHDCYVTGAQSAAIDTGGDRCGGFIGITQVRGVVENCDAVLQITNTIGTRVGGLLGFQNGVGVASGFFDSDIAGTTALGGGTGAKGAARTTAQMQASSNWAHLSTIQWSITSGQYPVLNDRLWTNSKQFITTAQQLSDVRSDPGGAFVLGADIDVSGFAPWDPIQDFEGDFDGEGHLVTGLVLNDSSDLTAFIGLFSRVWRNATITRLGVQSYNVDVNTGSIYCAPLIGANHGWVNQCFAAGGNLTISTDRRGGLIGITGAAGGGGVGSFSPVNECYAATLTNSVPTFSRAGGISAFNGDALGLHVQSNFFDSTNWQTTSDGTNGFGAPYATASMFLSSIFYAASWDYTDVWNQSSGQYPQLIPTSLMTYPASGFFYDAASTSWANGAIVGKGFNHSARFVPLHEGYVEGINMRIDLQEVNSGDLPRDTQFFAELLAANSSANSFLSPETGSWTIVSTGGVTAQQVVEAMSAQNTTFPWLQFSLNSAYLGVESLVNGPGNYAGGVYDWIVRFRSSNTAASSAYMVVLRNNDEAHPIGAFYTETNSGVALGAGLDYAILQFNLQGQIWPNSRFNDIPQDIRYRSWGNSWDATPDRSWQPGTNNSRAVKFTAMSDKLTKALVAARWVGTVAPIMQARIYTTNSAGDYPETLVGCAYYSLTAQGRTGVGNWKSIFNGNINNNVLPLWFIFSGGLDLTSGGEYWLATDADSYAFVNGVTDVAWMCYDDNSGTAKRAFSAGSAWSFASGQVVGSQDHLFELWYDVGSYLTPGAGGGGGAAPFFREFPTPGSREFPSYVLREFPRP